MSYKKLTDKGLIEQLEKLVSLEKRTTAELIEILKEVDSRRLYLGMGHTSLFAYLTEGLGYTPSSAQRRISAARLLRECPEVIEDLKSGELNLTQISMLSQSVRTLAAKGEKVENKSALLKQIKNKDLVATQKILAKELDLPMVTTEKVRIQKDDSWSLQTSFTEEERLDLQRVKELISHIHPNPTWAELFTYLAKDYLNRKDPLRKPANINPSDYTSETAYAAPQASKQTRRIPAPLKRFIFQRDQCCQWRNSSTQTICGSRFQLEIDHRHPIWAGGSNELSNLQVLCAVHNKLKYRTESGQLPHKTDRFQNLLPKRHM